MLLPHVVFHVQFLAFQYRLDNCYVIRLITVEYISLLRRKMKWYSDLLFLFLPACRMAVFSLKFRMNFCTIQSQHLSMGIRCATIGTEKGLFLPAIARWTRTELLDCTWLSGLQGALGPFC